MGEQSQRWYASRHEDDWTGAVGPYQGAGQAIAAGPLDLDVAPGDGFYVGLAVPFRPRLCGESILDGLASDAWDHAREHAGDWPRVTSEQAGDLEARLNLALAAWLDDHGLQPTFYQLQQVERHTFDPGEND